MTNTEEENFIHGILDLAERLSGTFGLVDDGMKPIGYQPYDINPLIARLQAEELAKVEFGNHIVLTAKGRSIARSPGGYHNFQLQQAKKARRADIKEWFGAWGSLIGGIAGVLSFLVSLAALWFSMQDAQKNEASDTQLSKRIAVLEQSQKHAIKAIRTLPLPLLDSPKGHTTTIKDSNLRSTKAKAADTSARKSVLR